MADAAAAFAAGWALTGASPGGRFDAGIRSAVLAAEDCPGDHVAETTLKLGHLTGTWATVYDRQDALYARHVKALTVIWRKLTAGLETARAVAAFRRQALMTDGPAPGTDHESPGARKHHRRELKAAAMTAVTGMLAGLPASGDWQDFLAAVADALAAASGEGFAAALALAASGAGHAGFDWDAAQAAGGHEPDSTETGIVAGVLVTSAAARLAAVLAALATGGATAGAMADAVKDALHDAGALALSLTHAMALAVSAAWLAVYDSARVERILWVTAGDDRVCFPAGTMVATPDGECPIESLERGQLVVTPQCQHRVAAAGCRPYSGGLTTVEAEGRTVTATDDHPFRTAHGWRPAGQLKPGDLVYTAGDHLAEVTRVVHVLLVQPDDVPAGAFQIRVAPGIPLGTEPMPVGAVRLDSDALGRDREVNGPASDAELLDERHTSDGECHADTGLQRCLASGRAVAGKRAELPVDPQHVWLDPELIAAGTAGDEDGRPAAFFRAIMPVEILLGPEALAAPLAVNVNGAGCLAGERADRVAVGGGSLGDREVLAADRAVLGDRVGAAGVVTLARAVGAVRVAPAVVSVAPRAEDHAAASALAVSVDDPGVPVAAPGAEDALGDPVRPGDLLAALGAFIAERHDGEAANLYVTGMDALPVYDIEVEHAHVFFANGFLVHNCAQCDEHEANNPWTPETFPPMPAHYRCRCSPHAEGTDPAAFDTYAQFLTDRRAA